MGKLTTVPRATHTGQSQEQDPGLQPSSLGESSKMGNKVSFDPASGYSVKYFSLSVLLFSKEQIPRIAGEEGLLIVRPRVISPS